jgi:hypothetical protein
MLVRRGFRRPQRLQQHFGLAVFEEMLAIVGAFEPTGEMAAGPNLVPVEAGAVDEGGGESEPKLLPNWRA